MRQRVRERVLWLLRFLESHHDFCVAWDEETVDDFVKEFPEAQKSLRYYMIGPNSSPMLNDAAGRAKRLGLIEAGHIGNQDARSFNQRTWCRVWSLTETGRAFLAAAQAKGGAE